MIAAIFEVLSFELRRTLTLGRGLIWLGLATFPATLIFTVRWQRGDTIPIDAAALIIFFLVPQVTCLLGLLLWATPAVQTELEGQTWIYLAVRPLGKLAVVFGKYLIAVLWTAAAGILSVTASVLACGAAEPVRLWLSLSTLVCLSTLSYGALYLLIGVIVLRRAIVFAVAYTLLIELAVSLIPATINKLTISHRLRALLADWMKLETIRSRAEIIFGEQATLSHLLFLLGYTIVLLIATALVVRWREMPMQAES